MPLFAQQRRQYINLLLMTAKRLVRENDVGQSMIVANIAESIF